MLGTRVWLSTVIVVEYSSMISKVMVVENSNMIKYSNHCWVLEYDKVKQWLFRTRVWLGKVMAVENSSMIKYSNHCWELEFFFFSYCPVLIHIHIISVIQQPYYIKHLLFSFSFQMWIWESLVNMNVRFSLLFSGLIKE